MIDPLVLLGIGLAAPAVLAVATPAAGATILVVAASQPPAPFSGRTAWARSLEAPLREFLRTETGGAAVLLAAAIAALVWVNVDGSSYGSVWDTTLSIDLGGSRLELSLREAKIGILGAALGASIVWLLFRITALLPSRLMHRLLLGTAEPLVDLYVEVDPERDHIRGPLDAPVTLLEYGDFGVSGTPTSFINGRRHHGTYDIATLSAAVRAARARAALATVETR